MLSRSSHATCAPAMRVGNPRHDESSCLSVPPQTLRLVSPIGRRSATCTSAAKRRGGGSRVCVCGAHVLRVGSVSLPGRGGRALEAVCTPRVGDACGACVCVSDGQLDHPMP
eukprot:4431815-Prymnesium_polylepis.1